MRWGVVLALHRTGKLPWAMTQYAFRRALSRDLRRRAWRLLGLTVHDTAAIGPGTRIRFPEHVEIGAGTSLFGDVWIDAWGQVTLGANVLLNTDVKLLSATHDLDSPTFEGVIRPIVIGDYAWLPSNIIVLGGVTIGRAAVVGAGSVVSRDVAEHTVVAGNPAVKVADRARVAFTYVPAQDGTVR